MFIAVALGRSFTYMWVTLTLMQWGCIRVLGSLCNSHEQFTRSASAGKASSALLLNNSVWLHHTSGDEAPPTSRGSRELLRTLNRNQQPHLMFEQKPILTGGNFTEVARSAPQGAQYYYLGCYILTSPFTGDKKGAIGLWQPALGSSKTFFVLRWTVQPYILYQVCDAHGGDDNDVEK